MITISSDELLIFTKLILIHENFIPKISILRLRVLYKNFLPLKPYGIRTFEDKLYSTNRGRTL